MAGFGDLTPEQLNRYRELRRVELEAKSATNAYLDSLLDEPLDSTERDAVYEARRDEFYSNNVGDGMDEERLDAEVEDMSDYEFLMNFGRLRDIEEEN